MSFAQTVQDQFAATIQYRSVKFSTLPTTKAEDIAWALLVHVDVGDIDAIQQDPGRGNWSVTFKEIATAEHNYCQEWVPANGGKDYADWCPCSPNYGDGGICTTGHHETRHWRCLGRICWSQADFTYYMQDFPTIKSGKFRVVLQPKGEGPPESLLPAYISINGEFLGYRFTFGAFPDFSWVSLRTFSKVF